MSFSVSSRVLLLGLFLIGLFFVHAARGETIRVAAVEIPLMIESETEGRFIKLLHDIEARSDFHFDITVYPGRRARLAFDTGMAEMLLPFPVGVANPNGVITTSIHSKRDYAFVRDGDVIPTTFAELAGKRVGLTKQYVFDEALSNVPGIQIEFANSDVLNMSLLASGRIDVFLVEEQSGLAALSRSGVGGVVYNRTRPISESEAVMVLKDDLAGRRHAARISDVLEELRSEGYFDPIGTH